MLFQELHIYDLKFVYFYKEKFINAFLKRISQGLKINLFDDFALIAESEIGKIESFDKLSSWIGKLVKEVNKKLVLIIDEVDRSSNNQLFLDFLAILRDRYLMRNENLEFPTFFSIVLSGVHDVKKLKYRIEPSATLKYNSPWNIAVDFKIDLCLNEKEIMSMLKSYSYEGKYVKNNILDIPNLLLGFQTFMQENHSGKNKEFLEKHGTLLFLAFTKPIINGKGFDFKEVQISEERRLDVVITYLDQKYIIELKIWREEEAHKQGLDQLSDYLDRQKLKKGYLLIYDFRINEKQYKHQEIHHKDKEIFAVWV